MKLVLILAVLVLAVSGSKFKRPLEKVQSFEQKSGQYEKYSRKTVRYAIKNNDKFEILTTGVRDLKITPPFGDWTAWSYFVGNDYNTTGWSRLEIITNANASDYDQAFGAGLLEGIDTRELINMHLINTVGDFCDKPSQTCTKLINFLTANLNWVQSQIAQHPDDPYWHQVKLVFAQFQGLYHGYYNIAAVSINQDFLGELVKDIRPYLKLAALQLNGDMSEILAAIDGVSDPFMAGSCSALIKLLPGNQDLLVSHDTWTEFESMLRILKHYKFNFHFNELDSAIVPGSEVSFSSYPGILLSIDDFYMLNSGLVVIETTIGNSNTDLWKYVTPETNLYWVRCIVANRLSVTGADWARWFSMHNSGTYNNEWMVVDYKQFYPGEPLRDGLFTVLEQLPGQTVWSDKTDVLRTQSYWPSYNLAYYPEVYNITGTYDAFVKYGSFFSYDNSPRASIFRRDQSTVTDIDSMIRLMRSNNYTYDEYSRCDCSPPYSGENAIAARSDLNPPSGKYPFSALGHRDHGATDMKLTSWHLAHKGLEFIAICGPTHNENIPPFVWSQADFGNSTKHFGHPDKWAFEPFHVQWKL